MSKSESFERPLMSKSVIQEMVNIKRCHSRDYRRRRVCQLSDHQHTIYHLRDCRYTVYHSREYQHQVVHQQKNGKLKYIAFLQVRHKFELIFLELSAKNKALFFI